MTSIKFHFRASQRPERSEGRLYIRVIHKRRVKSLATGYSLYPEEWDGKTVKLPEDNPQRRSYLKGIRERMQGDIVRLKESADTLSLMGEYSVEDVCKGFAFVLDSDTLQSYCDKVSKTLDEAGQERTARAYRSATRSLMKFNSGNDLRLGDICAGLIGEYEKHLIARELQMNTISFYMRNIRALYNRAVNDKLIPRQAVNPFEKVFTGVAETRRRALNESELNALAGLEKRLAKKVKEGFRHNDGAWSRGKQLQDSLMYFMFCYHSRGMSFVDMAYLRKSDIREGVISYQRKKTGGRLNVMVTKPMKRIISFFARATNDSPYVFPVIDPARGYERRQYESGLTKQNKHLKTLANMAGIKKTLSTHVSRHTWATLAKWSKEDISVISEALGHRDIKTTEKYLASFERSTMDRLSEKMSGMVKSAA